MRAIEGKETHLILGDIEMGGQGSYHGSTFNSHDFNNERRSEICETSPAYIRRERTRLRIRISEVSVLFTFPAFYLLYQETCWFPYYGVVRRWKIDEGSVFRHLQYDISALILHPSPTNPLSDHHALLSTLQVFRRSVAPKKVYFL